jgi:hypothetical protein
MTAVTPRASGEDFGMKSRSQVSRTRVALGVLLWIISLRIHVSLFL